jgi:hypothetical protein
VTGTGFTGIDKAWIGSGQDAQTEVMSDTRLLITVPADATSGNIAVLNPRHSAFSSGSLTVSATASYAQPSVTSFSPNNGPAGTVITVKGKGFTGLDAAWVGGGHQSRQSGGSERHRGDGNGTCGCLDWLDCGHESETRCVQCDAIRPREQYDLRWLGFRQRRRHQPRNRHFIAVGACPRGSLHRCEQRAHTTARRNVSGLEFVAVQGWDAADPWGGGAPNFGAIKTWKSNTVRLPLNEASWLGYTCVDGTGASRNPDPGGNYKATVQKAVSEATAAGLYVILDLHWTAPKNFCPLAQNPMADTDNSLSFWTSIATTFKRFPNVLFEMFNEPYLYWITGSETDWAVLMQGGTETQYVTGNGAAYTANYTWHVAGMQQMLIAGVTWAQDLSHWVANAPKDPLKQIAAVWHAYPDSGTVGDPKAALPKFGSVAYTYTQSVITAGYPVLITEFGDHNVAGTLSSPFVSNLLPWADAHGASYTGWSWNAWGDHDNILIKDDTGTPSDGYGVYTKAHYLCAITGSSNCL